MILSQQIIKSKSITTNLVIAFSGSIFLALLARLSIPVPFSPVPITGQTFGILFLGATLGSRLGAFSVIMYIAEGIVGLPVFANGTAGFLYLFGPTGGYLFGFIPAAFLVGYLAEKGLTKSVINTLFSMIVGTAIIFIFGVSWLSVTAGFGKALILGIYPYLIGAGIKILLATIIVYSINRFNS